MQHACRPSAVGKPLACTLFTHSRLFSSRAATIFRPTLDNAQWLQSEYGRLGGICASAEPAILVYYVECIGKCLTGGQLFERAALEYRDLSSGNCTYWSVSVRLATSRILIYVALGLLQADVCAHLATIQRGSGGGSAVSVMHFALATCDMRNATAYTHTINAKNAHH